MKKNRSSVAVPRSCFAKKKDGVSRKALSESRISKAQTGVLMAFILLFSVGCGSQQIQAGQDLPSNTHVADTTEGVQHNQHDTTGIENSEREVLSPHRKVRATIGKSEFQVSYSAPSVRERVIWGGLVGYDRVWVTGAHSATFVQFNEDIYFNDNLIPAGKYAFFTIPGKESWTVILNENWNQHLADEYDPNLDILRLDVIPQPHEFTEQLQYTVTGSVDGTGFMEFAWEELNIRIELRGPTI